jgi:AraC-like DNA-binding protein
MSSKRVSEPHLVVREIGLVPAGEWNPDWPGWLFAQVTSGQAYSMHSLKNQELDTGAFAVFPTCERGYIRASQVSGASLHYFYVEPERLVGLITVGELRGLLKVSEREKTPPRILAPEHPVSEKFRSLCSGSSGCGLPLRMQLLEIFTEMLAGELKAASEETVSNDPARTRMEQLLQQLPMVALVDLSLNELVEQLGCTPRHVSRLFHEVVGTSFRTKQSEVRLLRARELLATTNNKVVDVAMESGFPSVSLFNAMFKRHFGRAPGEWREQCKNKEVKWRPVRSQIVSA